MGDPMTRPDTAPVTRPGSDDAASRLLTYIIVSLNSVRQGDGYLEAWGTLARYDGSRLFTVVFGDVVFPGQDFYLSDNPEPGAEYWTPENLAPAQGPYLRHVQEPSVARDVGMVTRTVINFDALAKALDADEIDVGSAEALNVLREACLLACHEGR
jgi:hypothetical protein